MINYVDSVRVNKNLLLRNPPPCLAEIRPDKRYLAPVCSVPPLSYLCTYGKAGPSPPFLATTNSMTFSRSFPPRTKKRRKKGEIHIAIWTHTHTHAHTADGVRKSITGNLMLQGWRKCAFSLLFHILYHLYGFYQLVPSFPNFGGKKQKKSSLPLLNFYLLKLNSSKLGWFGPSVTAIRYLCAGESEKKKWEM